MRYTRYYVWRQPWNALTVIIRSCSLEWNEWNEWNVFTGMINKIVFTSPEARVEFSREKIKPRCWSKPFEHIQIYIRLKGQL